MIISSLLYREQIRLGSNVKALWTPSNKEFETFVISSLNVELLNFNQLYYGNSIPNIIICNNKVDFYNECLSVSRKLHLPVLLIDHTMKNPIFDNEKIKSFDRFPCMHHICISKSISDSWLLKDVQILSYDINNKDNISIWKNLIYQTSKKIFKA